MQSSEQNIHPIYCDRCHLFSLAELDGKTFCTDCLVSEIETNNGAEVRNIRPLKVRTKVSPLPGINPTHLMSIYKRSGYE